MLLLLNTGTADKLQLTSSSASALDVDVSYMDASNAVPPVVQGDTMGRQVTAISSATTTDICAGPASNEIRNVKEINIVNKGASANTVTIVRDVAGTDYTRWSSTLAAGDILTFVDGIGWYQYTTVKLDVKLRVTADVTNATTSFADITGLTYPVESGKHYGFEAFLFHIENASTTGARFGINGPSMTAMRVGGASIFAGSLTAATWNAATADVSAVDTSILGVTTSSAATPQVVTAFMAGWINPSAAGTFAVRSQSEVAVAAGVTIKAGSWCRLWEF